jgi:hypothetical protein
MRRYLADVPTRFGVTICPARPERGEAVLAEFEG